MLKLSDDRRSRRSRKMLKEGLLDLMREKRFSDISVRDITDRMDMNRGTFYLHYADTTALLQSAVEDLVQDIQAVVDTHIGETAADTFSPVFAPVLDYIIDNRELCDTLFMNGNRDVLSAEIQKLLFGNGYKLIEQNHPDAPKERVDLILNFLAYGMIGLIKQWFDTDMKLPKEELVATADSLTKTVCTQFL